MSPKELIGIKPTCKDCGWEGQIYRLDIEGNFDCAQLSAVIETRLGHCIETGHVNIECRSVYEELPQVPRKASRRE